MKPQLSHQSLYFTWKTEVSSYTGLDIIDCSCLTRTEESIKLFGAILILCGPTAPTIPGQRKDDICKPPNELLAL